VVEWRNVQASGQELYCQVYFARITKKKRKETSFQYILKIVVLDFQLISIKVSSLLSN